MMYSPESFVLWDASSSSDLDNYVCVYVFVCIVYKIFLKMEIDEKFFKNIKVSILLLKKVI